MCEVGTIMLLRLLSLGEEKAEGRRGRVRERDEGQGETGGRICG